MMLSQNDWADYDWELGDSTRRRVGQWGTHHQCVLPAISREGEWSHHSLYKAWAPLAVQMEKPSKSPIMVLNNCISFPYPRCASWTLSSSIHTQTNGEPCYTSSTSLTRTKCHSFRCISHWKTYRCDPLLLSLWKSNGVWLHKTLHWIFSAASSLFLHAGCNLVAAGSLAWHCLRHLR